MKKFVKNIWKCGIIIIVFIALKISFAYAINAHNLQAFNNYCDSGMIKSGNETNEESTADASLILSFDAEALMFRKNGIMKIGEYNNKEVEDPYEVSGPGELAKDCIFGDRIYKVIGKRGEIDDSYKNNDQLNANEKMRQKFELELNALSIGYRGEAARGFGKYNLRVEKNLVPFLKYVDRFYKAVDYRYGKTQEQIDSSGHFEPGTKVCEELEALKNYHSKSSINNNINDFKSLFKKCNEYVPVLSNDLYISEKSGETTFETLQDMFMALVYLKPALKELKAYYSLEFNGKNINELTDIDRAAIISMAYDKFSDRVLANGGDEENDDNLTITMKIGDIYFPLIKYENFSVAQRIYHYMIEIKYANNPDAQSRWVAEAEKMLGGFAPLDYEEYEKFYKAYQDAYNTYGKVRTPATAYDYNGEVLNPEDFESTHKFDVYRNGLATYLRNKFNGSSFFTTSNNAEIAARNYMIVSKMVEDQEFSDITEIYCSDVELVTHSYGYESTEIMLADFTRAELNDEWGTDTDTDGDTLNDNVEAYEEELLDIQEFVKLYCQYNNITGEERERYLREYGTTKVYNFKSSPVLPDTDFDGRNDKRDQGHPLDNRYKIDTTSNNYNISVDFNMDYRYFFMKSSDYYAELSKMSAMLANAIIKHNNQPKLFNVTSDGFISTGITNYMYWLGMEHITYYEDNNEVPFAFGRHNVKYHNHNREVIAVVIGEDDNYKDILSANYDTENAFHSGFLEKSEIIYEKFDSFNRISNGNKVYWIVGYGTGGSIANIFANRLIDEKGAGSVYCYTFGSKGVINIKGIMEKIDNAQNESIFNLRNIDDVSLADVGVDWYLYGRDAVFSLAGNKESKKIYDEMVSSEKKYDLDKKRMIEMLSSILNDEEQGEIMNKTNKNKASNIAAYLASATEELNKNMNNNEGKLISYELVKNPTLYDLKQLYIEKASDREKSKYVRNVSNIVEVIDIVGEWYAANLYTYQAGTYGAESFSNATGVVTYYQGLQEQMYQDKFREDFRENWLKSSQDAKDKRRNYMIENKKVPDQMVDLIMQNFDVPTSVINGTFSKLNADVLVKNERYTAYGRTAKTGPRIFGYYSNPFTNTNLQDDCSSFVSIVIYLFVNNNKDIKEKYQSVPNYTSSKLLQDKAKAELEKKGFRCYEYKPNNIEDDYNITNVEPLVPGDILVRNGHVEFYLDENWSFGWGEVHGSYEYNQDSKSFKWHFGTEDEVEGSDKHEGYYFYNLNKSSEGDYTRVFRYEGNGN